MEQIVEKIRQANTVLKTVQLRQLASPQRKSRVEAEAAGVEVNRKNKPKNTLNENAFGYLLLREGYVFVFTYNFFIYFMYLREHVWSRSLAVRNFQAYAH